METFKIATNRNLNWTGQRPAKQHKNLRKSTNTQHETNYSRTEPKGHEAVDYQNKTGNNSETRTKIQEVDTVTKDKQARARTR